MSKIKKILIIEDDQQLQKIYGWIFARNNFQVDIAMNGEEALSKVATKKYDVILLDIMLPKISGLAVLKEIRKPSSKTQKVPVAAITNLGQNELSKEALKIGANEVLVKNQFTPTQIVHKIETMLMNKK